MMFMGKIRQKGLFREFQGLMRRDRMMKPFLDALRSGEREPAEGLADARRALEISRWNADGVIKDCQGKYKSVAELADHCRRLRNAPTLIRRFLLASAYAAAKYENMVLRMWIKNYRSGKVLTEKKWWFVTDCDHKVKQIRANIERIFQEIRKPYPVGLLNPVRTSCKEMITTVDEIAPQQKMSKSVFKKGARKLEKVMRKIWRGKKVVLYRNGVPIKVPVKVLRVAITEQYWTVRRNALGVPTNRWVPASVLFKVKGEKHCRITWGARGVDYVVQDYTGRRFENPGGANFSFKTFMFARCR